MRMFKNETRLASRMGTAIAVLSVLLLGACAGSSSKAEPEGSAKNVFTAPDGTVTERAIETNSSDIESDKAGCTHIRFCDQPNSPNVIVCDTNDSTTGACSDPATRCFECCDDARTVCGTANPITFDPGFPGTCHCG